MIETPMRVKLMKSIAWDIFELTITRIPIIGPFIYY